ncbi:hypothetical protein [Nocardia sp. NPDC005825]
MPPTEDWLHPPGTQGSADADAEPDAEPDPATSFKGNGSAAA